MLPKHPDQLSNAELDSWVRRLVDIAEPEGTLLDYKQEIKINRVSDRRELAKDVASFANEIGGTIIYGVPEKRASVGGPPTPTRPYGIDAIPGLEQNL
ncbi:MAG: helix-turn-helix domain-containing protein, partial [Dehalococcoidia bacterium]